MKKISSFLFLSLFFLTQVCGASPWAEGETYGEKAGGKAVFGLKNTLLGWTAIFTETVKYDYYLEKKEGWEGFCYGISKSVLYTATGAIQLVTFPIPVDFPNLGEGVLHTSIKDQAAREQTPKKSSPEELRPEAISAAIDQEASAAA